MHVPTRKRWLRVSFCTELMHLDGALRDSSADVFENIIALVGFVCTSIDVQYLYVVVQLAQLTRRWCENRELF